ncbi:unnamed protein product [Albugo candida]|uniref:Uncharacterized protein n=1 Tax=Albugo candida TaxID=65357 RepID=A0A024GSY9_9STRA|nr:unnamed protein product [Albugo candida]|eukprot:CCI49701.1 unnamed protein product [Albugo candida]
MASIDTQVLLSTQKQLSLCFLPSFKFVCSFHFLYSACNIASCSGKAAHYVTSCNNSTCYQNTSTVHKSLYPTSATFLLKMKRQSIHTATGAVTAPIVAFLSPPRNEGSYLEISSTPD